MQHSTHNVATDLKMANGETSNNVHTYSSFSLRSLMVFSATVLECPINVLNYLRVKSSKMKCNASVTYHGTPLFRQT